MFLNSKFQKPLLYTRPSLQGRVTKRLCGGLQILIRGFKSLPALLFLLLFFIVILTSITSEADLIINEVMCNPAENEYYHEWLELYNPTNESINISGYTITDNRYKDFIEPNFDFGNKSYVIPSKNYAILTDHGTEIFDYYNISNQTICLYVDDKSIGNGLGNAGDFLILKNSTNSTIDYVEWINNYSNVPGNPIEKISENYTISKIEPKKTNNSEIDYYEGIPTPGKENILLRRGKSKILNNKTDFLISKDDEIELNLKIQNLGAFRDNITVKIKENEQFFNINILKDNIILNPKEKGLITLKISPNSICYEGHIKIIAESEKKLNASDEKKFYFEINNPDLWIKKIKVYNEEKIEVNSINQGEIIRIKAFLKNLGVKNATNIVVNFYKDEIKSEKLIGSKFYDSISKYQKYPSILFDTISLKPGINTIFVYVDKEDNIDEIDENNNFLSFEIKIVKTSPDIYEENVCISEFYYYSHPTLYNEYFKIYNPSNKSLNISGWYVTNQPEKNKFSQNKLIFPKNTTIKPKSYICVTEKADSYYFETLCYADFEYNYDTDKNIPQMDTTGKMYFSNSGGKICIKNSYNHTIDLVVYENKTSNLKEWKGQAIKNLGEGFIYKRKFNKTGIVDTDKKSDWKDNRYYKIGQTDLTEKKFNFSGKIQTFVSPDSSFKTIIEYLKSSKESIYLNIYEITSPYLCDELIKLLIRNVSVNLLIEGSPVGGVSNQEKFLLNKLKTYGAKINILVSQKENKIYKRYRFNHAKYLIIDNKTVIIKSCNWANTGIPKDSSYGNREWGIIIENKTIAKYYYEIFFYDSNINFPDVLSFEEINWFIPYDYYIEDYYCRGIYEQNFESQVFFENCSIKPVFSPDISLSTIATLLKSAQKSIYIEQLYIYKNWDEKNNPLLELLVKKAKNGVDVRIIMNYNPFYKNTNEKLNQTKNFLEENNIKVKLIYTNWSVFINIHNKGVIVDNKSVLISSINWNENSFMNNREAGVIVYNENISKYYSTVFFYDWKLNMPKMSKPIDEVIEKTNENTIYIVVIFSMTFALIAQDWRKRKWM